MGYGHGDTEWSERVQYRRSMRVLRIAIVCCIVMVGAALVVGCSSGGDDTSGDRDPAEIMTDAAAAMATVESPKSRVIKA